MVPDGFGGGCVPPVALPCLYLPVFDTVFKTTSYLPLLRSRRSVRYRSVRDRDSVLKTL